LASRGASTTVPLSTQERDNTSAWGDEVLVTGIANSVVGIARLSRDGAVLQATDLAQELPTEVVPLGLPDGALVAFSLELGRCELLRLDAQLAVTGSVVVANVCDNPRLAYAPSSNVVLFVYADNEAGSILVSPRDPDTLAEVGTAT